MRILLTLAFMIVFTPFISNAEDAVTDVPNIAVIDILALQNESKAAKSIKDQVKKLRDGYMKEFKAKEKELQKAEKDLIKDKDGMEEEAFAKKAQNFQKKVVEESQKLQKRQKDLDEAVGKALNKLRDEIVKITGDVSTENDYTLVLPRQGVFYFERSMNITDEVMKRLDKKVKTIKVNAK